ncbi:hypothetical protein BIZ82_gp238 [Erwinia phage vB_EamM_EarlPhillipIV]|uniref:Uncharacterized protein n=1 Tax=Erwinia phage vB_EamM_EarlPhillipIV TaxID=1883372 RepID=A0A1B2ICT3_9CAUD|nr:hypothetical protein BIZ82_gp238 [Erwinia phage vB_EamM_EarlPhillipIV]ANZ49087.1 hypothetical protein EARLPHILLIPIV_238 [Erwinia phage vB_EamM_EarlPhillipIV]
MIRDYLKKTDWSNRVGNVIPENEPVELWVYPHGCVCSVKRVDGISVIQNGHYTAVNTTLGNMLLDAGIEGEFILYSTEAIPQNTSRWLTWWLSNQPGPDDEKLPTIQVTTFGIIPKKTLPFQVTVIRPQLMRATEVTPTVMTKSRDRRVSIFIVKRSNGEAYELEPTRRVDATILSYTDYGFIVRCAADNAIFRVPRIARRVMDALNRARVSAKDLCGQKVTVQYTMKTEGLRLSSYKSPLLLRAHGLDEIEVDETDVPSYEKQYPFNYAPSVKSGSLTPTRCSRASIRKTENGIEGYEDGTSTILFTLKPTVEFGQYATTMSKGDGMEVWAFESDFAIDSLNPKAFARCVSDAIFQETGYSLDALGLYYSTPEGTWIGDRSLASEAAAVA